MNEKQMEAFISNNIYCIDPTDAYYIQYQQAANIRKAMMEDIETGSLLAATDQVIFTIGNKALNIGCFNAEAVSAFDEALLMIMQNAVENIHINEESDADALLNTNLSYILGKLLMDAATDHIAPNAVAELAYDKLYSANIDDDTALALSDMMQELAQFVEPPIDND